VIFAQEKYEQAVIMQINKGLAPIIFLSIEGQEFKTLKVKGDDVLDKYFDYSPLLKQIGQMRNEGWEVWNTNDSQTSSSGVTNMTYFLRRKIK